ncbi:hypothetical protein BC941DRAFT_437593 [Chlamydoabsidia padenii]|nr:hypothetical protein BC941DRAFT_437593 [Chlamydoabsidia padenii]
MAADSSPNSTVQRALEAEKKVERLERQLEALKLRLKETNTSNGSRNLQGSNKEKMLFQLDEQVKDLKYQLSCKVEENTNLQETLSTRTGEYESKLKKMREIFGQATKNIDKYRATISSQEQTIAQINDELAEANLQLSDLNKAVATFKDEKASLELEIKGIKSSYQFECGRLEDSKRQLGNQLEQTRTDYEQYKKRAHQLMQQRSDQTDDSRLGTLQSQIKKLEMQKMGYETEKAEQARKIELMDLDIRQSLDRIRELQAKQTHLADTLNELDEKRQRVSQLEKQMKLEREDHDKAIEAVKGSYEEKLQQLMVSGVTDGSPSTIPTKQQQEQHSDKNTTFSDTNNDNNYNSLKVTSDPMKRHTSPQQQQEETAAMESIMEYLNEDNTRLRQSLEEKEQTCVELQQKILQLQQKWQQESDDDNSDNGKNNMIQQTQDNHGGDVYESMMQLLSPLISRPETKSIDLEKQVARLQDMLQESEDQITALRKQEKLLKDEVRKLDSVDKRQNMSVEYIKNVLLKFLTSENKEYLVPVLAKVLFLDPAETEQLQRAV